jgi:hypothetical protein
MACSIIKNSRNLVTSVLARCGTSELTVENGGRRGTSGLWVDRASSVADWQVARSPHGHPKENRVEIMRVWAS